MVGLSLRQRAVLVLIRRCQLANGWTPSVREIGAALGMRSPSTVQQHLSALERKGYLYRPQSLHGTGRMVRALTITELGLQAVSGHLRAEAGHDDIAAASA